MKFLVIGLGSMGKRRIRNLLHLGYTDITGFDNREDRRVESKELYNIKVVNDYEETVNNIEFDAFIISVPPDLHHIYMEDAVNRGIPFFVEASVLDTKMVDLIERVKVEKIVAAPSATMLFHPAIVQIREILNQGSLGKVSNFTFHSGQFLEDWHSYEKVKDFYVSNRKTGGAREIVPFELTWLTTLFGQPASVLGNVKKTINIEGAEEIDDTYNFIINFEQLQGVCTVDVVSRVAVRRLMINGDKKQLVWDWNKGEIEIFDGETQEWDIVPYDTGVAQDGYNKNIGEKMYIDEMNQFIQAVKNNSKYINTLEKDLQVLKILYAIEMSSEVGKVEVLQ